ncbi:MAG: Imm41 family immunity protein [Pseudomonadota bacterium]
MQVLMFENIFRNLPGNANWVGSFYEQLTEHGIWNKKEFWLLLSDLILAANKLKDSESVDKQLAWAIVKLQSNINGLLIAHFDEKDVFAILDMSTGELYAFKERFDLAVVGIFSGEVLPEDAFELTNPLL